MSITKPREVFSLPNVHYACFDNFVVNLLGAIAAYCFFPKKPCINVQRTLDTQIALF